MNLYRVQPPTMSYVEVYADRYTTEDGVLTFWSGLEKIQSFAAHAWTQVERRNPNG